jgi:hypothetical protein
MFRGFIKDLSSASGSSYVQEIIMSRTVHTDGIDNWYMLYTTYITRNKIDFSRIFWIGMEFVS